MQNNTDISRLLSELKIKDTMNIEEDLGNGYVRLKISEAERRQALQDISCVEDIVVELLRNSRDAGSRNIFIGTKRIEDKRRKIYFIDDGKGIPPKLQDIIFESRVTSKLEDGVKDPYGFHGRGMALFSIKLNTEEVKIVFSDNLKGASFYLDVDLSKVPEKKDQSLMPQIISMDDDINIIGGVNNILKTIIEFQLQNEDINFYYGSPTQILSTMREILKKEKKDAKIPKFDQWSKLMEYVRNNNIKVTEIPTLTDNYNLMDDISKKIFNMDISRRGIQRVIYNEIKSLDPLRIGIDVNLKSRVVSSKENSTYNKDKADKNLILYDENKLAGRFKDEEIRCIIKTVEDKIRELGDKYFITTSNNTEYKKVNNIIKLMIELKQKE
jgi:hypothetical protein